MIACVGCAGDDRAAHAGVEGGRLCRGRVHFQVSPAPAEAEGRRTASPEDAGSTLHPAASTGHGLQLILPGFFFGIFGQPSGTMPWHQCPGVVVHSQPSHNDTPFTCSLQESLTRRP